MTADRAELLLGRLAGWTRIVFGAAFVAAPTTTSRPWVGTASAVPGARMMTRSMGVRDLLLGVGLLHALDAGDAPTAARWLGYGAAAGAVDAAATVAAYPHLSRGGRAFLGFIASALVTDAALAWRLRARSAA